MNKLEIMVRLACADIAADKPARSEGVNAYAIMADALIAAAGEQEAPKGTEIEVWAVVDRLGVIWMHDIYFDDENYNREKAKDFDKAYSDESPHQVVRLTGRVK